MLSIGKKLDLNHGVGPGFDILRISLALLILFGHTRWIANGTPVAQPIAFDHAQNFMPYINWALPRHSALVPMFFALSGFLVTASAMRSRNTLTFLTSRALRILPALVTEVTLSALVLGPILTTWALTEYFSDGRLWEYFGNIVGRVVFTLPGLFEANPVPKIVNINLWTLTAEFYCYALTSVAMTMSIFYNRALFTIAFCVATLLLIVSSSLFGLTILPSSDPSAPYRYVIVYYFFMGSFLFLWRNRIPLHPLLLTVSLILGYGLLLTPRTIFIAPLFIAYVTVYLGMMELPKLPFLQTGDYSYGVYLYGFPITQALVSISPRFCGHPWLLLGVTVSLTIVFSVASWHLLEKRFLSLKRVFYAETLTILTKPAPPAAK